jgi:hypothetical protein
MSGYGYNFFARLLHRLALQYTTVAEISFDIENASLKKRPSFPDNHVFISGLARSGSTMLLNYLYATGRFRSLTYRDMPFLLMPGISKKLSRRGIPQPARERAHRDGIMVSLDSPEAFEEAFWRVFCGENYIFDDKLKQHKVSAETSKKFKDYISAVLRSGGLPDKRYLSKNNNNILRLGYLQQAFPQSHIIIPFRRPLQQAISLQQQHIHFSKIHAEDGFSLSYMSWLGHFEFGLNQKPFFLGDDALFKAMEAQPKTGINFWLLCWKNYYRYALAKAAAKTIFFNYEHFCSDPEKAMTALFKKMNITGTAGEPKPFSPPARTIEGVDPDLLDECMLIYHQLTARAEG